MDKKGNKIMFIRGANVFEDGAFRKKDVEVRDGIVSETADTLPVSAEDDVRVIEGEGKYLVPGLVDMHVHLREPGFSYKETIRTGTEAAEAGGFSVVCAMPNLNPAPDTLEHLGRQLDIIEKEACIKVIPYATITMRRMGDSLVDYEALAPFVAGFSDDGSGVQDEDVMHQAMLGIAPTGKILAAHCEVNSLLRGGYIHDGEYASRHGHRGISSESEWREIERDIRLAEATGCRLHVCHISTKESVALIRAAKKRGVRVTCETGPHYLTFCDEDLQEEGRFKMNPPLRSRADMEALREGVADGTIDVIATDHAPHSEEEKSRGLEKSAMGVVGLETSFAAVYTTMVRTGLIGMERLAELMSINARKILGLGSTEGIKSGVSGELTLLDTVTELEVRPESFRSKGKATPYAGMILTGKAELLR